LPLGYDVVMVVSAEDLGWIAVLGLAILYAVELALSAYLAPPRSAADRRVGPTIAA